MKVLRTWVRMPSPWVQNYGLRRLKWATGQGSNNTAALMVLVAIVHHVEHESDTSYITYEDLMVATNLSKAKIAAGIKILAAEGIIVQKVDGRSSFKVVGFEDGVRWGKMPARGMYTGKVINAFRDFTLRNQSELNAMKLFVLFVVRRNNKSNMVELSYDKISEYTDMPKNRIRSAITLLGSIGLVHLERSVVQDGSGSMFNAYRLPFIDPYGHPAAQVRSQ